MDLVYPPPKESNQDFAPFFANCLTNLQALSKSARNTVLLVHALVLHEHRGARALRCSCKLSKARWHLAPTPPPPSLPKFSQVTSF